MTALAAEQLGIADDLDALCARALDDGVRFRMRQWHAGRQHQRMRRGQSHASGGAIVAPCAAACSRAVSLIVPRDHIRAASDQRSARAAATPESPRPNTASFWFAQCVTGIMILSYRNLSVDKPISASTTEMIQNLTTTVASAHPFCSKW